jgi:hypothetical protein
MTTLRGVEAAHDPIPTRGGGLVAEFEKRWHRFSRAAGTSRSVGEAQVSNRGKRHSLDRVVDEFGKTADVPLRRERAIGHVARLGRPRMAQRAAGNRVRGSVESSSGCMGSREIEDHVATGSLKLGPWRATALVTELSWCRCERLAVRKGPALTFGIPSRTLLLHGHSTAPGSGTTPRGAPLRGEPAPGNRVAGTPAQACPRKPQCGWR